jgi:hypothetical protein
VNPPPPHAIDGDLVAFGAMLSGMAMAGFMVAFMVLCFTAGGPLGASMTVIRWAVRLCRKDPFPLTTTGYWLSTTASFPAWPTVRVLIAGTWSVMVGIGVVLALVDLAKGPKQVRTFVDPNTGQPMRVVSRMKAKRVLPKPLDKAAKATTPARDRIAYGIAARRWATNQERRSVGLDPLPEGRLHRKLVLTLPTGKTKEPKLSRKEKTEARRDARARVSVAKAELPPPPPVSLGKGRRGPKAGVDPAAPPRPPEAPPAEAEVSA